MNYVLYITLGLVAGVFGGIFGLGGGLIFIPALVYIFKFMQHQAQGTSLWVMLPPVGFLAAWRYYQSGNVKLGIAPFVCLGFFLGGWIGASLAQNLSEPIMRKFFGILMLLVSLRMIFVK
jgi:uncharacterized membrane protein YfcA